MFYDKFEQVVEIECQQVEASRDRWDVLDVLVRTLELDEPVFEENLNEHLKPVYAAMKERSGQRFKCVGLKWGEWKDGSMLVTMSFFRWRWQRPRRERQ